MITHHMLDGFGSEILKLAKETKKKPTLDKQEMKSIKRDIQLFNKLRGTTPIKIEIGAKADRYGGGYFDQIAKEIGLSRKDYETLAHEMGHAELDKRFWGKIVQNPVARGAFPWTPVAGALGGVLASRGKKLGLLLPVATVVPTLISEGAASSKGKRLLREVGATEKELGEYQKEMGEAFGTYFASVPMAAVAAALGHKAATSKISDKASKGALRKLPGQIRNSLRRLRLP